MSYLIHYKMHVICYVSMFLIIYLGKLSTAVNYTFTASDIVTGFPGEVQFSSQYDYFNPSVQSALY